jgi:hypothetical protein
VKTYEYSVSTPVSLEAHASVLVPFIDAKVKAERGVWLKPSQNVGRSVVRVENTTQHLIPAGLLTVFEGGRYAGTTQFAALEAQQTGFVDFGMESALTVKWDQDPVPPTVLTVRSVVWDDDGNFTVNTEKRSGNTIQLTNTGDRDLAVYVELPVDDGTITGADRIETLGLPRPVAGVINVPAHKQVTRTLLTQQTEGTAFDFDSPDLDEFKKATESTALTAATRTILKAAFTELLALTNMQMAISRNEEEIARIEGVVERLPSSNTSPGIAGRIVQLENQRLVVQERSAQLEHAKQEKLTAIKKRLSQLKAPAK